MLLDLVLAYGLSPQWEASTAGGEYSSACPACGGRDRFRIQPHKPQKQLPGYYFCRQCSTRGDCIQFCKDFLNKTYAEACDHLGLQQGEYVPSIRSLIRNIPEQPFSSLPLVLPPEVWCSKALALVSWCHRHLLKNDYYITYLEKRGVTLDCIKTFKLGYNPSQFYKTKQAWGIDEPGELWFAQGIVIPGWEDNQVIRLKIRRDDYKPNDEIPKYIAISGSSSGYNILGKRNKRIAIAVESELDAFPLYSHFIDKAVIFATGSCTKNPDAVSHELLSNRKHILVAYDNDEGGEKMWKKWKSIYKVAKKAPVSVGKDIGDALQQGYNLEEWFSKNI